MIIMVSADACYDASGQRSYTDQFALVEAITKKGNLCVTLLGDDTEMIVAPGDITGLQLDSDTHIEFKVKRVIRNSKGS